VARRLFRSLYPLDRTIWAGEHAYTVVGVIEPRGEGTGASGSTTDVSIFVPLTTMAERYGDVINDRASSGTFSLERVQLHRIVVETAGLEDVPKVAAVLRALMQRWHPKEDVRLTVPLELLREARESKRMFTIALAFIGAISLLVGGIGIMNIMLASVMERTREVGVRRALGARKRNIIVHFLAETVLLALIGGALGLGLGLLIPVLISHFFEVRTVVTPFSLALAFSISAAVGVIFGLYPAARAADLDPVEALRRE
jgi:putative ABC transport system permease protein